MLRSQTSCRLTVQRVKQFFWVGELGKHGGKTKKSESLFIAILALCIRWHSLPLLFLKEWQERIAPLNLSLSINKLFTEKPKNKLPTRVPNSIFWSPILQSLLFWSLKKIDRDQIDLVNLFQRWTGSFYEERKSNEEWFSRFWSLQSFSKIDEIDLITFNDKI